MSADEKLIRETVGDVLLAHPLFQTIERETDRVHMVMDVADWLLNALGAMGLTVIDLGEPISNDELRALTRENTDG